MFVRRVRLRVPALLGVFLLLLSLTAEAAGIKACPHGTHAAVHGSEDDAAERGHGHHEVGREAAPASDKHPEETSCECGFHCIGASGPTVGYPPAIPAVPAFVWSTSAGLVTDDGRTHRPSPVPFLLPYAQGPPPLC